MPTYTDPTEVASDGLVEAKRDAHPQLLEASRKHQSGKARRLMEEHVLESADHLTEPLEARARLLAEAG